MNEQEQNSIKIGNYRIFRCDEQNIQVDEFKTVKAKRGRFVKEARETEKWVFKGFYGNVHQAATCILREQVDNATAEVKSLNKLIEAINDAEVAVVSAVKEAGLKVDSFPKPVDGRGRKKAETVDVAVVGNESKKTTKKRGRPAKVKA